MRFSKLIISFVQVYKE